MMGRKRKRIEENKNKENKEKIEEENKENKEKRKKRKKEQGGEWNEENKENEEKIEEKPEDDEKEKEFEHDCDMTTDQEPDSLMVFVEGGKKEIYGSVRAFFAQNEMTTKKLQRIRESFPYVFCTRIPKDAQVGRAQVWLGDKGTGNQLTKKYEINVVPIPDAQNSTENKAWKTQARCAHITQSR